ncbi:MAG: YhbY family RNA-binding protein [bacterium]
MDKKLRRELMVKAMKVQPIFTIGKMGITDIFLSEIDRALKARELIKIAVGRNCSLDCRDCADLIADKTNSQVVQLIGRKIVLYRKREDEESNQQK